MALVDAVSAAIGPGGPLALRVPEYRERAGQTRMAMEVARTIDSGGVLVVEAGTGIGKTYAYLLPALLSGQRVLISTATKALQDQLYQSDLPKLVEALGIYPRVALLKGRSSYLCLHRLASARLDAVFDDAQCLALLGTLETWSLTTRHGDFSEVGNLDDHSPVIPLVSSTRDNCLGGTCPEATKCHVNLARRNAMAADLVVVNHHLFFADLNIRESGVAEILPTVKSVIFDEAHQINEVGVQFLGRQISSAQIASFQSDVQKVSTMFARGFADWDGLRTDLNHAVENWRGLTGRSTKRMSWGEFSPLGVKSDLWVHSFDDVVVKLRTIKDALTLVAEVSPELEALYERSLRLLDGLCHFQAPCTLDHVRWMDVDTHLRIYESPLNIGRAMQQRVFPQSFDEGNSKSWVFTSATLGQDDALSWFKESCGLTHAKVLKIQSPFDYASQAALYVPLELPAPSEPGHAKAVASLAAQGALAIGGRTLVLTTTLRSMRTIGMELRDLMVQMQSNIVVMIQGEAPKHEIIRTMVRCSHTHGVVVVASVSFWEGVDIPGAALQLLVIDKLPFSPPDDPIQQARAAQLEQEGKSPFKNLFLPQAAIALKQGAGRLIRRESDRGILAICDNRLISKGYGRKLLAGLPPMQRLENQEQFQIALNELTKLSTTDLY